MLTVTTLEFQVQDDIKLVLRRSAIFYNVVAAIKLHCIDCIGTFNGRFFDSAAVVHACQQSNIDYFVYDVELIGKALTYWDFKVIEQGENKMMMQKLT